MPGCLGGLHSVGGEGHDAAAAAAAETRRATGRRRQQQQQRGLSVTDCVCVCPLGWGHGGRSFVQGLGFATHKHTQLPRSPPLSLTAARPVWQQPVRIAGDSTPRRGLIRHWAGGGGFVCLHSHIRHATTQQQPTAPPSPLTSPRPLPHCTNTNTHAHTRQPTASADGHLGSTQWGVRRTTARLTAVCHNCTPHHTATVSTRVISQGGPHGRQEGGPHTPTQ